MFRIAERQHIAQAPEALGQQIGGFDAAGRWYPLVARVEAEGASAGSRSTVEGRGGSRQAEGLLDTSAERRSHRCRMESSRMPVPDAKPRHRSRRSSARSPTSSM